jgi:hypothetical protein
MNWHAIRESASLPKEVKEVLAGFVAGASITRSSVGLPWPEDYAIIT